MMHYTHTKKAVLAGHKLREAIVTRGLQGSTGLKRGKR